MTTLVEDFFEDTPIVGLFVKIDSHNFTEPYTYVFLCVLNLSLCISKSAKLFLGQPIKVVETEIDLTDVLQDASEDTTNSAGIQGRQYILVNCVAKHLTKCFITSYISP